MKAGLFDRGCSRNIMAAGRQGSGNRKDVKMRQDISFDIMLLREKPPLSMSHSLGMLWD